ncbi:MAG: TonB-dependent receptor [Rikenellaceae bacterium]|nr:TonB-dependent receptor [Rikenellaceae bacterium]
MESVKTGEHLPYITITVKGTNIGIITDATGHYFLKNLPIGQITLQASSIGYATVEQMVQTEPNKTLEVNFMLEEASELIENIVVSATRNETSKKEAPVIVNVLSHKLFESTASANLTEVMNFQPGLRVENNCGNCGTTQLRINGLEGQYSQILLDSRPIFSSLAGVYGLEQLPVGMIERVEVIRGGGSALFGASAIGGVVNIITKEPLRNSVSISNTTNLFPGGKADINTSFNGSFVSDDHRAGLYLFGMLKDRSSYDRNGDGFSNVPKINSETLGFRGYYRTSDQTRLTAEYHHIHEFRRGGNAFDRPPHQADIAEQLNHKIDGGGLRFNAFTPDNKHRWDAFASAQIIKRDSYFGIDRNEDAYGMTDDKTFVVGSQYTYAMNRLWFLSAELTAGLEYTYNDLHDRFLGLGRDLKQTTRVWGGYLQNEWKNETFSLLIGTRLDKHNLMDKAVLSPRANVRYSPTEQIGLRASYSSGYRAPQAYDEDLHVEAVGGMLSMIELADNLKPEYSHSLSASADLYKNFGAVQTNLLVEGFYTILDDVFTLVPVGMNEQETIALWERRNGSGSKVQGVNFEGKIGLPGSFDIQLGYTLQSSRYDRPEDWTDGELAPRRKIPRAPNQYGYFTSTFELTRSLKAALFGNYTGSMLARHTINTGEEEYFAEKHTPRFWDMGVKFAYTFQVGSASNLELSAGVKNIFDQYQKDLDYGILKDASYVYGPALPRMYFFGVKFSL